MKNTKIEWADHTFNPWVGCTKVSPGCANCYAEALMDRRFGRVEWGPQGQRVRTSAANWRKPLQWDREAKAAGTRARVFCASLADVFEDNHEQRAEMDEWREELFILIHATPNLDWLLLTKRPENVLEMMPARWRNAGRLQKNFWIGTSVENQAQADKRVPELLKIPARVRFLSVEPLLGPADLSQHLSVDGVLAQWIQENVSPLAWPIDLLDWVIVGGESGPNARPMHPDWVRSIRDQCVEADIPFFFKQWGEWAPNCACSTASPCTTTKRPQPGLRGLMFRCGKAKAGRLLDGREWNEVPGFFDGWTHDHHGGLQ